ncbi:genetic suppressor element 1 isoform X1 [Arapaima gigas]
MTELRDKDLTAVPRKRRLMAAVVPVEESALPAQVFSAPERSGAALVYCFVCGSGVTAGKELRLQVKPRRDGGPFFPFLQHQEPAPGARGVTADGGVQVCAVCHSFLGEQWNSFERSGTPMEKRMYWLKRPYQCDPRRAPQDWNASFEMERRTALGVHAPESDSSSFSENENMSDQEPDRGYRVPPRGRVLRDAGGKSAKSSPDSERAVRYVLGEGGAADSSLGSSSSPLVPPHMSHKAAATFSPAVLKERESDSDSDVNITSEEDGDVSDVRGSGLPAPLDKPPGDSGNLIGNLQGSSGAVEGSAACYICGNKLSQCGRFRVYVQKQERAASEPFFPFLWLHKPPPGALPLSTSGGTLVCACCHTSLMQQWQGFELASVPVLQRLYVVPLSVPTEALPSQPVEKLGGLGSSTEACYLCGQDCGADVRVAYSQPGDSKTQGIMHFPFITLLPCPPGAQGQRGSQVHCCVLCYSILEDIWAAYRLCLCEELITSVNAFLGRYHQVVSGELSEGSTHGGHACICYLCGAELGAGCEFQLSVNPPGRCGKREPFFPFLSAHPAAPRAKPVDSTGLVSTCVLCYHDLRTQWVRHEGHPGQPASSPWSRQYRCDTFVCFFCRQERRRCLGLKAVHMARLPVFLYAPAVSNSLVVDDGKKLTIGSCVECKTMLLAGWSVKQHCRTDSPPPPVHCKVRSLICLIIVEGCMLWLFSGFREDVHTLLFMTCFYNCYCDDWGKKGSVLLACEEFHSLGTQVSLH